MQELKLEQKLKKTLQDFIENLKGAYGNSLISVILYGSAARREFSSTLSDVNLLIVLDNTSMDNLNKISKTLSKRNFRSLDALFFTEDYILSSLDVFPVEFLDIKSGYSVLHGKDCLKDLEIDLKNLRFQCEHELKAKLINLRSLYLRNRQKDALRKLLFAAATSITHIVNSLLRLKGINPSHSKEVALKEAAKEFGIDAQGFLETLKAKQENRKLSYEETEKLFFSLVADLEKIVSSVDTL